MPKILKLINPRKIFNLLQHKTSHFSHKPKCFEFDEYKYEKYSISHKRQNTELWLANWISAVIADVTVSINNKYLRDQ